jgi:hypothetical protein
MKHNELLLHVVSIKKKTPKLQVSRSCLRSQVQTNDVASQVARSSRNPQQTTSNKPFKTNFVLLQKNSTPPNCWLPMDMIQMGNNQPPNVEGYPIFQLVLAGCGSDLRTEPHGPIWTWTHVKTVLDMSSRLFAWSGS